MNPKGESMEALPYYRWLWRDWRANRKVQRMAWQARGLYRELLDEFWSEGYIPDDLDALADICGCTRAEMEQFWPQIEPAWERVEGGYRNVKMESQRTAKDAERITKANSGRKGGLACNSRTRAEELEASGSTCLATAKDIQAQPDIALARALAVAKDKDMSPSAPVLVSESKPKQTRKTVSSFSDEDVESIWKMWPNKGGKRKGLESIRKALAHLASIGKPDPVPDLKARVRTWLTWHARQKATGEFIAAIGHAQGWFGNEQQRYMDDDAEPPAETILLIDGELKSQTDCEAEGWIPVRGDAA